MKKYFKDLLVTLKSIDESLKLIAKCVHEGHHRYGDRTSISTKHWND